MPLSVLSSARECHCFAWNLESDKSRQASLRKKGRVAAAGGPSQGRNAHKRCSPRRAPVHVATVGEAEEICKQLCLIGYVDRGATAFNCLASAGGTRFPHCVVGHPMPKRRRVERLRRVPCYCSFTFDANRSRVHCWTIQAHTSRPSKLLPAYWRAGGMGLSRRHIIL